MSLKSRSLCQESGIETFQIFSQLCTLEIDCTLKIGFPARDGLTRSTDDLIASSTSNVDNVFHTFTNSNPIQRPSLLMVVGWITSIGLGLFNAQCSCNFFRSPGFWWIGFKWPNYWRPTHKRPNRYINQRPNSRNLILPHFISNMRLTSCTLSSKELDLTIYKLLTLKALHIIHCNIPVSLHYFWTLFGSWNWNRDKMVKIRKLVIVCTMRIVLTLKD